MTPIDPADRITSEWSRVYSENPAVYQIPHPERIARLGRSDFMTLISGLGLPRHARILESGCGSGRDSLYFASCGHSAVALDRFETPRKHLAAARERYERAHRPVELEVVAGDIFDLPFPADEFDLVFNSGVLEHYTEASRRATVISEMARVARPGGLVAISVPNLHHPFRPLWDKAIARHTTHDHYDMAETELTATTLADEMQAHGLDISYCGSIDVWETLVCARKRPF